MSGTKLPRVRLQHILDTIDGILAAADGLDDAAIAESFVLLRASERAVQIISEAAKELPAEMRAAEPETPWRSIIGIGNLLRHEYYRIRPDDIVDILRNHLPALREAASRMLVRLGEP
jgi:uncharacterized protein with HEPN domain